INLFFCSGDLICSNLCCRSGALTRFGSLKRTVDLRDVLTACLRAIDHVISEARVVGTGVEHATVRLAGRFNPSVRVQPQ
uniref:Uncharacterized protein n=1 Tax=Ciona savignyi TaxID=51511 RepID=H2ZFA4_CIOSA